ncbi:hypothetical protein LCGC14_0396500 [marine sediment metagenome]|uniref:Uncharacterized protein n=1 Tax=marine sediment metagenome TaxID=412755 RepID=A0A0F9W752_9ZZZZ
MKTNIFIREKVKEKWGAYDIGDPKLSDEQVYNWLTSRSEGGENRFLKSVVMALLRRGVPK